MLSTLFFQKISLYIDPLLKYDEDGYPIEDDELSEEELALEEELDMDDGFDVLDDDLLSDDLDEEL